MSTRAFGYTVSELGLILAFLFMAQMLRDRPSPPPPNVEVVTIPKKELEALRHQRDSLRVEADSLRKNLRSPQLPSCISRKIAVGPIGNLTIAGADAFILEGEVFSARRLQDRYSPQLAEAKKCGCVHTIVVRFRADVSTEAYDRALARLEETFYVKRMGAAR
jgi:hypothetical protein